MKIFKSEDTGEADRQELEKLLENMMAPRDLRLKIGAQVMLVKNKDESLVNGTTGKIVRFAPAGAAVYEESDEEDDESLGAVPKEPKPGASATGASTMAGLIPEVPMKKTMMKSQEEVPWVEWILPDGRTTLEPVAREEFKVEQGDKVRARRKQVKMCLF